MAIRPSVPEIITVNSEELQTAIRDLLPSQNGFGSELQASNVITPVIDLTPTAEGSGLPQSLQQSLAFGSQTAFNISNATTAIASSPGFYRVTGAAVIKPDSTTGGAANWQMTDGLSVKIVWDLTISATTTQTPSSLSYDLVFWLAPGITLSGSANTLGLLGGSIRQVADAQGQLLNPSGYPL